MLAFTSLMDISYVLTKCADKSFKAFRQLKMLKELPDKFNLETYLQEFNIGSAYDTPEYSPVEDASELLDQPEDPVKERISRYNDLKENILKQLASYCVYLGYYEQESNNRLSEDYFKHFLLATDKALSEPLEKLEKVFEQNECDFDTVLATALGIRYGIDKGFLRVENK
jgi:hypothetical protein